MPEGLCNPNEQNQGWVNHSKQGDQRSQTQLEPEMYLVQGRVGMHLEIMRAEMQSAFR